MELRYLPHIEIRLVHDKKYAKGGAYKKWHDKPYSSTVHRASLFAFIISFGVFSVAQSLFPNIFNLWSTNQVQAGANTVTWTTRGDFENNDVTTVTPTSSQGVKISDLFEGGAEVTLSADGFNWLSETTATGAPEGRSSHTAVWTGEKMIIWGGSYQESRTCNDPWGGTQACPYTKTLNTGGIYDPATNSWSEITLDGAPLDRTSHTAVWTGEKMIVWGGHKVTPQLCDDGMGGEAACDVVTRLNTGGIYDPVTNSWTVVSTTSAPDARSNHTAVWTGEKMIIWGGYDSSYFNSGGIYNPVTDSWSSTSVPTLTGRHQHTAVWTGEKMIIWGGSGYGYFNNGSFYDPVTNSWTAVSTTSAPAARSNHTAVWTGEKMIIWGGNTSTIYLNTGSTYDPVTDSWVVTSTEGVPDSRTRHTAVWTGEKMIIWGGSSQYSPYFLNTGGLYDPVVNGWAAVSATSAPAARSSHTAVWTGEGMIIWGGWGAFSTYFNTGALGSMGYTSSATLSNLKINAEAIASWSTISWNGTEPTNTNIKFQTRGASTEAGLTSATWQGLDGTASTYYETSGDAISTSSSEWLEIKLILESSDGANTPTLNDFTVTYDTLDNISNSDIILTKADGTSLKDSSGNTISGGTPGAWTGSSTLRVTANNLSCTGCANPPTNLRPEVEIKEVGTVFNGEDTYTAESGNTYVDIPGLNETDYHLRVRSIDDQGRISAWTNYGNNDESEADISIDQTPPTGTVTIGGDNVSGDFTRSRNITLTLDASDTGGSNLSEMRFSNDGTTWSDWETYATTKDWTLAEGDDGERTVYTQFRDNGGSVSGKEFTLQSDWESGTLSGLTTTKYPGSLTRIDQTSGYADATIEGRVNDFYYIEIHTRKSGNNYYRMTSSFNQVSEHWVTYVYKVISGNQTQLAVTETVWDGVPGDDFRFQVVDNSLKVYMGTGSSWSQIISTTDSSISSPGEWAVIDGSQLSFTPQSPAVNTPNFGTLGETGTALRGDSGEGRTQKWMGINSNFSSLSHGSHAVKYQISTNGSSWIGPNGAAGDWNNNYFGQVYGGPLITEIPTSLAESRYLYIKIRIESTETEAPVLDDIFISSASSASITLDTQPPTAFGLISPATNTWQQSSSPTLSWSSSSSEDIVKYQLFIDGNLNRDNIDPGETSTTPSPALTQKMSIWKIRAIDAAGNYTDSTETWNIGYDAIAPSKALDPGFYISASDTRNDDITVTWNTYADDSGNGSPAATYALERLIYSEYLAGSGLPSGEHNLTSNWSLAPSYNNLGNKTSPVVQVVGVDIESSVRYIYRIKVTDMAGNISNWLVSDIGLTADTVPPNPGPRNVTAIACDGTISTCPEVDPINSGENEKGYSVKLSWDPADDSGTGVTGYKIYRKATTNSVNELDFSVVGYLDVPTPNAPISTVYYDNDANNDATFTDTIAGELVNVKSISSPRLNDFVDYFYRITAIDDSGNETDVIIIEGSNYATIKTPDVTNPEIPTDISASAMGLDGLDDDNDPKQRVDVSWTASSDNRTPGRIPSGSGSGIASYSLYFATSGLVPVEDPSALSFAVIVDDSTETNYSHVRLDERAYYYYKVMAKDMAGNESQFSDIFMIQTLSSQVPSTPTGLRVEAVKGNPLTNSDIGSKVNVKFIGSRIKYSSNKVIGYEVYRSTTNWASSSDWLNSQKATKVFDLKDLNIVGDTYDGGDSNCPSVTLPDNTSGYYRCFTDTVPSDATTYYYRAMAFGYNPDMEPTTVSSGLSSISAGTINVGWDTVPDVTAPELPTELKVKDIHDDGLNFKRNIITWKRISTPTRNGFNDFLEYRIYRSTDGLVWSQIKINGINPLYNEDQEIGLATNYYMDLIPISESNQYYYYYVTAVDNAATDFRYPNPNQGTVVNAYFNESTPNRDGSGVIENVSLNPAIAQPSILTISSGEFLGKKASIADVNVSSAVISWTTDQSADSLVEFRKKGTNDPFITIGDRKMVTAHVVRIFDLLPSTEYEYRIISRNFLANDAIAEGPELPTLKTNGFTISNTSILTTTSTAEIKWRTNLDSKSNFVEYQLNRLPGDESHTGIAGDLGDSDAKNHTVVIKGLRSGRSYTYKIKSISNDNYLTETAFLSFSTRSFDSGQFTLTPSSTNVAERNISATSAQIVWATAMATTSWVDYGTRSGVYDYSSGDDNLTTQHVVKLENLESGKTYYYRVRVKDANEVEYVSQEYSFKAIAKPKISNIRIQTIEPYRIVISWETNVATETAINWGTSTAYGKRIGVPERTKNHLLTIDNLMDDTEYHYQIVARDEYGNEVVDDDKIVRTPMDKEGPKIENVKIDLMPIGESDETAQVIISWNTNKPATTKVEYDEGLISGSYSKSSIEDTTLSTSHTVIIKGLNPATTYHFRMISKDRRDNTTYSNDYNFVTPEKNKSIWQLIVRSLEETFGWVSNVGDFFKNIGRKVR